MFSARRSLFTISFVPIVYGYLFCGSFLNHFLFLTGLCLFNGLVVPGLIWSIEFSDFSPLFYDLSSLTLSNI